MNSRQQYLDLFRDNRETIDSRRAPALNRMSQRAFESIEANEFPRKGHEGHERTDVNAMFAPDYGLNITRLDIPADIAATWRCDVPNMSTLLGIVVNDSFQPSRNLTERLPDGVVFASLSQTATEHPELVEPFYGSVAPIGSPTVAVNTLFAQDGVIIRIPRGVKMTRPLQLVNIFSAPTPLMAPRRVLIVMEAGAEAQILVCDHSQDNAHAYLASEVVEIVMFPDSRLDYYTIEESSSSTTRHSEIFARQADRSSLMISSSTLTCGQTRNNFSIETDGTDCQTTLAGMAIASGEMRIDNSVSMRHLTPRCKSSQLFKYVADGHASCAFQGRILVDGNAPFTDATQTCRSILASPDARMHAKPQLEIYNDEVICSHGATTGQLDNEALFYMQSRGIPVDEARKMLMQAFMADVIDTVRMEGLRDRLRHLVEKRFDGNESSCADCHGACAERKPTEN
ncbi:MAG: SufD family Fe-S cluster assembly protein [Paramuribaculum sp.]|nr:SufD family Fe-S cluster assembly protein [Paramuribaculum sp.]